MAAYNYVRGELFGLIKRNKEGQVVKYAQFDCDDWRAYGTQGVINPEADYFLDSMATLCIPVQIGVIGWEGEWDPLPDPTTKFKDENNEPHLGEYVVPFKDALKYFKVLHDANFVKQLRIGTKDAIRTIFNEKQLPVVPAEGRSDLVPHFTIEMQ